MITSHLGAIDLPYEDENIATGDVAEYLEEKYQIMQAFFDRYGDDITGLMSKDLTTNLKNMLVGAPPLRDSLAESMPRAHDLFVAFLDNEEMNGMSGVPTRRTLLGISKRFRNKKGDPRTSFIDTGDYQAVVRAWVSGILDAFPE